MLKIEIISFQTLSHSGPLLQSDFLKNDLWVLIAKATSLGEVTGLNLYGLKRYEEFGISTVNAVHWGN